MKNSNATMISANDYNYVFCIHSVRRAADENISHKIIKNLHILLFSFNKVSSLYVAQNLVICNVEKMMAICLSFRIKTHSSSCSN
jgi:hypothetical protein